MRERLLGSKQRQIDACQRIVRTSHPLLVIDLRRQAQSLLRMRQSGPPPVPKDIDASRRRFRQRLPRQPTPARVPVVTPRTDRAHTAARLPLTVQFVSPLHGPANSRTHGQAGAQHTAVAHARAAIRSLAHSMSTRSDRVTSQVIDGPQADRGFRPSPAGPAALQRAPALPDWLKGPRRSVLC